MTQGDSDALRRHGGRLDEARRLYPAAPEPWLDLSTGINPNPWAPPAGLAYDPAPLPSPAALAGLEAAAAAYLGVAPERVAAVPGSETAIRWLPHLGLPRPLLAAPPTYGTHLVVADEPVADGNGPGTLLVANPNNPDGHRRTPAELRDLVERRRAAGGWLVIDQAFADADPDNGALPGLEGVGDGNAPVVVLRSFGKFFGLAGLRLGFVVGPPGVIARVRALAGDWPVGTQALAWGTAAYADAPWIAAARASLLRDAARLDALLARHGLLAEGECPLFRLVRDARAGAVFEGLARAGILARPFADRPDWLRFGLPGDDRAFARLDRALARG